KPQANAPYLFLEYFENGSLEHSIQKLAIITDRPPQPENLPDPPSVILWEFWRCLVTGVVGMEYPEIYFPNWDMNANVVYPSPNDLELQPRISFVHNDLDPQNLFVGKTTRPRDPGHPHAPEIKVADLGSGNDFDHHTDPWLRGRMWSDMRKPGKTDYVPPEQFSEEWDYVDETPHRSRWEGAAVFTAGQFGWKTNLYQAALSMQNLITRCYPRAPPMPVKMLVREGAMRGKMIWTYSGMTKVTKFPWCDPKLLLLVSQCLADRPDMRPDLKELHARTMEGVRRTQDAVLPLAVAGSQKPMDKDWGTKPFAEQRSWSRAQLQAYMRRWLEGDVSKPTLDRFYQENSPPRQKWYNLRLP
ncbi:hypothetical protein QBC35DRAFT_395564, partial [Podospora australis]